MKIDDNDVTKWSDAIQLIFDNLIKALHNNEEEDQNAGMKAQGNR
jgi:hypothetical protein